MKKKKFSLKWCLGFIFLAFYLIGGIPFWSVLLKGIDPISPGHHYLLLYERWEPFYFPAFYTWFSSAFIFSFIPEFGIISLIIRSILLSIFLLGGAILWFYIGYGVGVLIEKYSGRNKNRYLDRK